MKKITMFILNAMFFRYYLDLVYLFLVYLEATQTLLLSLANNLVAYMEFSIQIFPLKHITVIYGTFIMKCKRLIFRIMKTFIQETKQSAKTKMQCQLIPSQGQCQLRKQNLSWFMGWYQWKNKLRKAVKVNTEGDQCCSSPFTTEYVITYPN